MLASSEYEPLKEAAASARFEGWHRWELPEIVRAKARQLGLKVSRPEVAEIVTAVCRTRPGREHP